MIFFMHLAAAAEQNNDADAANSFFPLMTEMNHQWIVEPKARSGLLVCKHVVTTLKMLS